MPVNFTPQFFSRSAPTKMSTTTAVGTAIHNAVQDPKHQKYSLNHGAPEHLSPASPRVPLFDQPSPLDPKSSQFSTAGQHYSDIDWTRHEIIAQNGRRYKFGSWQQTDEDNSHQA